MFRKTFVQDEVSWCISLPAQWHEWQWNILHQKALCLRSDMLIPNKSLKPCRWSHLPLYCYRETDALFQVSANIFLKNVRVQRRKYRVGVPAEKYNLLWILWKKGTNSSPIGMVWHRFMTFYFHWRQGGWLNDKSASYHLLLLCDSTTLILICVCEYLAALYFSTDQEQTAWLETGFVTQWQDLHWDWGKSSLIVTCHLLLYLFFTTVAYLWQLPLAQVSFSRSGLP